MAHDKHSVILDAAINFISDNSCCHNYYVVNTLGMDKNKYCFHETRGYCPHKKLRWKQARTHKTFWQ